MFAGLWWQYIFFLVSVWKWYFFKLFQHMYPYSEFYILLRRFSLVTLPKMRFLSESDILLQYFSLPFKTYEILLVSISFITFHCWTQKHSQKVWDKTCLSQAFGACCVMQYRGSACAFLNQFEQHFWWRGTVELCTAFTRCLTLLFLFFSAALVACCCIQGTVSETLLLRVFGVGLFDYCGFGVCELVRSSSLVYCNFAGQLD